MHYHWGDNSSEIIQKKGGLVLGIDPILQDMPKTFFKDHPSETLNSYVDFLISVTADMIGFIKFQSAFFEAFGSSGITALAHGISLARSKGHGIILDAKRGDIGSTSAAYARAYLDPSQGSDLEVDCMTVNPFLGPETLEPFFQAALMNGKGIFVLVKTSNSGSGWLQDQQIDQQTVSTRVAKLVAERSAETVGRYGVSNVGAVVGATYAEEGQNLRKLMPSSVFLAPGVGSQGGNPEGTKQMRLAGGLGVLVPVSRGITKTTDLHIHRDEYAEVIRTRIDSLSGPIA